MQFIKVLHYRSTLRYSEAPRPGRRTPGSPGPQFAQSLWWEVKLCSAENSLLGLPAAWEPYGWDRNHGPARCPWPELTAPQTRWFWAGPAFAPAGWPWVPARWAPGTILIRRPWAFKG